jgi:hypothetical protein
VEALEAMVVVMELAEVEEVEEVEATGARARLVATRLLLQVVADGDRARLRSQLVAVAADGVRVAMPVPVRSQPVVVEADGERARLRSQLVAEDGEEEVPDGNAIERCVEPETQAGRESYMF